MTVAITIYIVMSSNTKVHRENTFFAKIHHYNAAMRRILR